MYAPHHNIPHLVKYSTALTEITEHCRACFRLFRTLLNQTKPHVSLDKKPVNHFPSSRSKLWHLELTMKVIIVTRKSNNRIKI